jgi:hypothetical protein
LQFFSSLIRCWRQWHWRRCHSSIFLLVRENNGFEIIDGEQRWRGCKKLGYTQVIIYNEGVISDQEAKELTIWYQQQVPFNEVDLASLVSGMLELPNLELPFSEEELQSFKELAQFDFKEFDKEEQIENSDKKIIEVTTDQYQIIMQAIAKVKETDGEASDGRCLELICGDFLSGK